jgi:hypothetical protein
MHEIALHGLRCPVPPAWEPVGTYGHWRDGRAILASGRAAVCALTWTRTAIAPHTGRTLRRVGRAIRKDDRAAKAVDAHLAWGGAAGAAWTSPRGTWHAGVRWLPDAGVALVARQLAPGDPGDLRRMLDGAGAAAPDQSWVWRLHGLDLTLPPWWRLAGLHHVAGLVRGVWFRHPREARRADAVFVSRRFALAERMLAGGDPLDWLRANLRRNDTVHEHTAQQDVWNVVVDGPATSWWRRWRGQRDRRQYRLAVDRPADRFVVHEFRGPGPAPWDEHP